MSKDQLISVVGGEIVHPETEIERIEREALLECEIADERSPEYDTL